MRRFDEQTQAELTRTIQHIYSGFDPEAMNLWVRDCWVAGRLCLTDGTMDLYFGITYIPTRDGMATQFGVGSCTSGSEDINWNVVDVDRFMGCLRYIRAWKRGEATDQSYYLIVDFVMEMLSLTPRQKYIMIGVIKPKCVS